MLKGNFPQSRRHHYTMATSNAHAHTRRTSLAEVDVCVCCCCCTLFLYELYVMTTNTFDGGTKNALRSSGQRPSASSIDAGTAADSFPSSTFNLQFFHNMYNFRCVRCGAKAVAPVLLSSMHCTQNKSALAPTMAPHAYK